MLWVCSLMKDSLSSGHSACSRVVMETMMESEFKPSLSVCLILPLISIEEDFVTWKEQLWPVVCQHFGIDSSQALQVGREYEVTLHTDLQEDKIFTGEPSKLGSLKHQKTYV